MQRSKPGVIIALTMSPCAVCLSVAQCYAILRSRVRVPTYPALLRAATPSRGAGFESASAKVSFWVEFSPSSASLPRE